MRQPVSTSQIDPGIPSEASAPKLRPQRPGLSAWNSRVAARLRQIAHGLSLRQIAQQTRTNSETVRRYMRSGKPCVRFLARFCEEFGVSADVILGLAPSPTRHSVALRAPVVRVRPVRTTRKGRDQDHTDPGDAHAPNGPSRAGPPHEARVKAIRIPSGPQDPGRS